MKLIQVLIPFYVFFIICRGGPIVHTTNGPIEGLSYGNINIFYAIPFAEPPLGDLRWSIPLPKHPWTNLYPATTKASVCMQPPTSPLGPVPAEMSEDCLYLNVFAPVNITSAAVVPVMVFIHGGAYYLGSPYGTPGEELAAVSNCIVVTVAYRLGVFGFLVLPEMERTNFGIRDQQLAMQWVHDNIENFGGDKTKIQLFGESVGGGSVLLHLLIESSFPYYSSAVAESPAAWIFSNQSSSSQVGSVFASSLLNCSPPNQLACLRSLTRDQILKAQLEWTVSGWGPNIDRDLILDNPLVLISKGQYNKNVPIIVGVNAVEGTLLAWIFLGGTTDMSDIQYDQSLITTFEQQFAPVVKSWYQDYRETHGNFAAFSQILGDFYITCGTYWASNYFATGSTDVWTYHFAHTPVGWELSYLNATHTLELAFIFHTPKAVPLLNYLIPPEYLLSLQMITLWTAMATDHDPSKSGLVWPKYDTVTGRVLMFDVPVSYLTTWESPICNNWLPVLHPIHVN